MGMMPGPIRPEQTRSGPNKPEPHWCSGCWAEMPAGSTGKCPACTRADLEFCVLRGGGPVHFADGDDAPVLAADRQYHGDYYRG